jgi:hypothetical protein
MNCYNNIYYYTPYFDQSKNIYNTQGDIVTQTQQQIFSDKFSQYLKNNTRPNIPKHSTYINKCHPPCCNPIKWDISEYIINSQYINSNVCNKNNQKKYRIG